MDIIAAIDRPTKVFAGRSLDELRRDGEIYESIPVAPEVFMRRAPFFHQGGVLTDLARFGACFRDIEFRNYKAKAITAYALSNVTVVGSDGVLMYRDRVIPESLVHLSVWDPGSSFRSFERGLHAELRSALPRDAVSVVSPAMIGFNPAWRNFAHWMKQSVPMIYAYLILRKTKPKLKVVLPRLLPGSFQAQTIQQLEIPESSIIWIDDHEILTLRQAYICSPADLWSISPFCRLAAERLSASVLGASPYGERIYIHRETTTRRVGNFHEIRPILEEHGFEVISFESMAISEQIVALRHARYIIAEHGAGLANIQFSEPGARVLEMFNPVCPQPAYWSLASVCGLEFGFLVGEHVSTERCELPSWNADYSIPPRAFETAIAALLAEQIHHKPARIQETSMAKLPRGARLTYSQFGEDIIVDSLLRAMNLPLNQGFYVDVGAYDPFNLSNTYLFHARGWRGINIDANPDAIGRFARERPDDINLNVAIAEQAGSIPFTIYESAALSTADAKVREEMNKSGRSPVAREIAITSTRLETVLSQHVPPGGGIDLMNIDVEGLGLEVLRSNDWEKYSPTFLLIEDPALSTVKFPNSEIFLFLRQKGYRLASQAYITSIYVWNGK